MRRKLRIGGKLVTKHTPEPEKPIEWEYQVTTILGFSVPVESPNHGRDTRDMFRQLVQDELGEDRFSLWRRQKGREIWEPISFNVDLTERQTPLPTVVLDMEARPFDFGDIERRAMAHLLSPANDPRLYGRTPMPMAYPVVAHGVSTIFANLDDANHFARRFAGYTLPPRPRGIMHEVYRTYGENFAYIQYNPRPTSSEYHIYAVLTEVPEFPG